MGTEGTEAADSAAAATDTATNAAAGDVAASEAQAEANWFQKNGTAQTAPTDQDTTVDTETGDADQAGLETGDTGVQEDEQIQPEAEADKPTPLSGTEKTLLKRMQLADDDTVAILESLPPSKREAFIAHLGRTQDALNRAFSQKPGNAQQQPNTQQQTQQPGQQAAGAQPQQQATMLPTPQADQHWQSIDKDWGANMSDALRGATHAVVQAHVEPLMQVNRQLLDYVIGQQFNQVMSSLQLPEGVNAQDPAVQQKIRQGLLEDLKDRFELGRNDFTTAAPRVIATLFPTQIAASQRATTNQQRKTALRATPEAGQRRQTSQPRVTEEDKERLVLEGQKKGLEGSKLAAYVNAGGSR